MKHFNFSRAALAGAVIFVALQACNREPDFINTPAPAAGQAPVAVTAVDAQRWYEAGVRAGGHRALRLYWNRAQSVRVGDEEHVIVPIGDTRDRFGTSPYRAYRRLVIRQRNGQPVDGTIIELLVQRSGQEANLARTFHDLYLAQHSQQRFAPQGLAGAAFFYTADYTYLTGYRYRDGQASARTSRLFLKAAPTRLKAGRGTLGVVANNEEEPANPTDPDNPPGDPGPGFPGNPDPFPLDPVTVTPDPDPTPPPPVDPGDPPADPGPTAPPTDPTDPYGGDPGGGWGGGTGTGSNSSPNSVSTINTNQLKPCEVSIINVLKGLSGNPLLTNLQKLAGTNSGYNWTVKDGRISDPNTTGFTSSGYDNSTMSAITTFDSQKFPNATDLSFARTMLHESFHAYLVVYFANDRALANAEYSAMVDAYQVQHQSVNDVHHVEMAFWVSNIANALEQYGQSKGYNLPSQFYQDMSWAGLEGTQAYKDLPSADKKRIQDTIQTELNGSDSSGNSATPSGKSPGC